MGFAGNCEIFVINDNGGQQYRFAPVLDGDERDRGSWISVDMERNGALRRPYRLNHDRIWEGAIGVIKQTDALLVGLRDVPEELYLDRSSPSTRAAWHSAGFLLRAAASRLLDVEPPNLGATPSVSSGQKMAPAYRWRLPRTSLTMVPATQRGSGSPVALQACLVKPPIYSTA